MAAGQIRYYDKLQRGGQTKQDDYFDLVNRRRSRAPTHFPGRNVIQTFLATEQMLEEVLNVVPFCQGHGAVWSHRLATVLLEAGSQIDSLWRFEAKETNCPKQKRAGGKEVDWNIRDFFRFSVKIWPRSGWFSSAARIPK